MYFFLVIGLCLNINKKRNNRFKGDGDTKNMKIMSPLKKLSSLWRILEMSLSNCETNLILTWSKNCVTSSAAANQGTTFAITDTKLNNNVKLLQQF